VKTSSKFQGIGHKACENNYGYGETSVRPSFFVLDYLLELINT